MRLMLALIALLWSGPLAAQVRVTAGEHDGFTRIVLQGPSLAGWQVTRLPDGYSLSLRGAVRFDLSRTFDLIGRQRLRGIAPLPGGDGLALAVGCACHAVAYDLRAGVVVLDLRDGPPPAGSSFELAASGQTAAPLQAAGPSSPRPQRRPVAAPPAGWNWARAALAAPDGSVGAVPSGPALPGPAAAALRDALLLQFGRGVADGMVDPIGTVPPAAPAAVSPPQAALRLGEVPGLLGRVPRDGTSLSADGTACPADEPFALAGWGDPEQPVAAQMAEGMAGLVGEFDRPDPDSVARAIRLRLWAGFGAEAAALTDAFGADLPDAPVWRAMALILDGHPAPAAPFAGMAGCDGTVALWAVLADPDPDPSQADGSAIVRAFSGLPPHLRRHLGPPLARVFLAAEDAARARMIRDAMGRADQTVVADLLDADLALAAGAPDRAADVAQDMAAGSGPQTRAALFTLTEARAARLQALSAADLAAIEAFHAEAPDAASTRAVILGRALAGDFDGAFALADAQPDTQAALWPLLAGMAPDSALIARGILPEGESPGTTPETARRMAARLLDLGFAEAALRWIGPQGDPVLAARAELARGDADAALRRLGATRSGPADSVRAEALLRLGNPAAAATILAGSDIAAERSARLQARQWAEIGAGAPAAWRAAADRLAPSARAEGPLAQGRDLVRASADTRAALDALLSATTVPDATALTESKPSPP